MIKIDKPTKMANIRLYHEDIELAKIKGINISELLRDFLSNYLNTTMPKTNSENLSQTISENATKKAELEAQLKIQEQIMAKLKEREIEEAAKVVADQEAQEKEESMCCMCGGPPGRHYQLVKTGPFKGRMLCGDFNTGCVKKVYDENITEWRAWLS